MFARKFLTGKSNKVIEIIDKKGIRKNYNMNILQTIGAQLNKLLNKTVIANWSFLLYCYLLQLINYTIVDGFAKDQLKYIFAYFIEITFICVISTFFPRFIAKYIRILVATVLTLITFIDTYCFVLLGEVFNPTMVQLMNETNGSETWEFFLGYVFRRETITVLLYYLPIIIIFLFIPKVSKIAEKKLNKKYIRTVKYGWVVVFLSYLILCFASYDDVFEYRLRLTSYKNISTLERECYLRFYSKYCSPTFRSIASVYAEKIAKQEVCILERNIENTIVDNCVYRSPNIVLIIGESYNRNHASIYGYDLATTPNLNRLKRKSKLYVFDNVVSCWNITSQVFKNMISTHSIGQPGGWADGTTFPAVFKKAGYHVDFITNQFVWRANQIVSDFSGGLFLNKKETSSFMFDCRNNDTYEFDENLLNFYDSLPKHNYKNRLTIFHTMGQHIAYNKRFPQERKKFSENNYLGKDLTLRERMITAAYDNATLYNDSIVNEIIKRFNDKDAIVIYLPDHGEEVFDETHREGRIHSDVTAPIARQEYRIPFVIWCSDIYRKKHPDVIRNIRHSIHKPFMTDDLCHMLFWLGGIECKYYEESRNLLSPNFNSSRKRILKNRFDYDRLMEEEAKKLSLQKKTNEK